MTKVLLLVEDDIFVSTTVETILQEGGYTILVAVDGNDATARLRNVHEIDGLITDIRLGDGPDGWKLPVMHVSLNP